MDKNAVLEIVGRFVRTLEQRGVRVNKAILYGSYASGAQHSGSDIDLVIVSDCFVNKDYWERIRILSDAIYEIWEPVEAVAMTPEEWERGDSTIVEYAKNGENVCGARGR